MHFLPRKRTPEPLWIVGMALITMTLRVSVRAEQVSLQAIVTPSTTILKDGRVITFAVHGFIEFKSLAELFPYIESQTRRWQANGGLDHRGQRRLAREVLRGGIESRVVSMSDERPLEALITHTSEQLRQLLSYVKEPVPPRYAEQVLSAQEG